MSRFRAGGLYLGSLYTRWHGYLAGIAVEPYATRDSFVLLMEGRDASDGPVTHWVLFDIPGSAEGLAEQEASIGIPGRNDLHHEGYTGPCPPPRGSEHRYVLRLYALDVATLGLPRGAPRREVENAMRGHVLEQAELMGRYGGR